MSPTQQTSPQAEEENEVARTATYEHQIGEHWLQFYDDGSMEIVDKENYDSGNEHGNELVFLTAAELALLKAHLCL